MSTRTTIAIGVGAGIVAIGAAAGVGALAANLAGQPDNSSQQPGYGQGGFSGNGGAEGRRGMDTTQLATALAQKLGVDEAAVQTALEEVMAADRPSGRASGRPSGPPTGEPSARPSGNPGNGQGGRGGQFLQTIARGLAEKLDLDEATVLAALQEVWQDQGGPGGRPSGTPTNR